MALDGLQDLLIAKFPKKKRGAKVNLVRYPDDFVITGTSKKMLANEVKPLVEVFLADRGLALSSTKTKLTEEGLNFLGENVRKYRDKLLIKPARKNVAAFLEKVRAIIKGNQTSTQAALIHQLNPVIRGWANYHRHAVAKAIFTWVDSQIWKTLWQWAVRRWIKDRYFHVAGAQHWVFASTRKESSAESKPKLVKLVQAVDVAYRTPLQDTVCRQSIWPALGILLRATTSSAYAWQPDGETKIGRSLARAGRAMPRLQRTDDDGNRLDYSLSNTTYSRWS